MQVNSIAAEMFLSTKMAEHELALEGCSLNEIQESDDESAYFTPETGNVLFASAVDNWACDLSDFAEIYMKRLNIDKEVF